MEEEIWKDIYYYDCINNKWIDYGGLYQVSNMGNVKSLNYRQTGKEKVLSSGRNRDGYLRISLYKEGKVKRFIIHRLVAHMFIYNNDKEHKTEVNHIDENKENNFVDNLEWTTPKQNSNHGTRNKRVSEAMKGENNPMYGVHRYGKNAPNTKRVAQYDLNGNIIKIWDCAKQVTKELGIDNSSIGKCCRGKQKSAGGYIWKYYTEED